MHFKTFTLSLSLLFASFGTNAATQVYKCGVNGTVHYQQTPCPTGETKKPPTVEELNAERQKRLLQEKENPKTPKSQAQPMPAPVPNVESVARDRDPLTPLKRAAFQCDGRKYCQQMTSCEEAKFFLSNCPGVKMDGDGDGIPCEDKLCGH